MRVAFVLWDGLLFGGAETATIALCAALRRQGVDARIAFVGGAGVYGPALSEAGVPAVAAGFPVGSAAARDPRRLTRAVNEAGADVCVVPGTGFLVTSLRLGGYRGRVVAVEHGGILQTIGRSPVGRLRDAIDRRIATPLVDAQVAVSDYLLERLRSGAHAARVVRIHNGIDLDAYAGAPASRALRRADDPTVVIGCAGKLMHGKGFEDVIEAADALTATHPWRIQVAGDGYLRSTLEEALRSRGLTDRVDLLGWVQDMPAFWASCDVAVAASNGCVESFGMVVAEAMASGIPAVVSRSGGLPEVLGRGGAGVVFDPGDVGALACALATFIDDEDARAEAGFAALDRARALSIDRAARDYAQLLHSMVSRPEDRS